MIKIFFADKAEQKDKEKKLQNQRIKDFEIPNDIKYTGTALKELREKSGISLQFLSEKSKIRVQILKALEEENIGELPSPTYIKGFLCVYAKFLGLNAKEVTEDYLEAIKKSSPNG